MAEPISTANILDRLHNVTSTARALDMAVGGAVSIDPLERDALDALSTALMKALESLHREISQQHKAEGEQAMASPLAAAIARHRAAMAVLDSYDGGSGPAEDTLLKQEREAGETLAATPCATDAEFVDKLRYLVKIEEPFAEKRLLVTAINLHLNPREAEQ